MSAKAATSADKVRLAQAARRKAAQKSAAQRRVRKKASVPVTSPVQDSQVEEVNVTPTSPVVPIQPEATPKPVAESAVAEETVVNEEHIDALCGLVDSNPTALGSDTGNVRQLCRNRRHALSSKGKAAIPGKKRTAGRTSASFGKMSYLPVDANGRDMAKIRRKEMARNGRGNAPTSRPSGRVRPQNVPPKVEEGTTLSGGSVTGTQVERNPSVTGNESGTCRGITGTEYIGSEQYDEFCGTKPEPNTPKVGFSITTTGMPVSGTEVGRSSKVTGDEQGSCRSITGTEYIGTERFDEFCDSQGANKRPSKVMPSMTERKGQVVTGSDEARVNATTGTEAGAKLSITGSQYSDTGAAKMTINGPSKVALTHTIAGRPVTGTEVGRSHSVTGDEQGSCRSITGTEYISNEQFSSVCQTSPVPHPAKVGVDSSNRGQVITGNMVDRTDKVTGNEPGSCKIITGSQYGESKLCGGAAPKAHTMHTLTGNQLTGNRVDHHPKLSGDEQGGCLPVTGTEYYGQEQYAQYCQSTPTAAPAKIGVEHTNKGQAVSGTMVSNTEHVTGNEAGVTLPVSGTPYSGIVVPENHGSCCSSCAARQLAEDAGLIASQPVQQQMQTPQQTTVQAPQNVQSQPQYIETQHVVAQPNVMPQQTIPPQDYYNVVPAAPRVAQPIPQDFSVVSPAREAANRVTGSAYGGSERITGPVNIADQLVSGTPEFRYQEQGDVNQVGANMAQPGMQNPEMSAVQMPNHAPVSAPEVQPQPVQQVVAQNNIGVTQQVVQNPAYVQRVTGEGREDGVRISGDNWGRSNQITGTEGRWAQGRNPTLRGEPRNMESGAHFNKGIERPDVATAMVTGSSGSSDKGAIITVSGGARG